MIEEEVSIDLQEKCTRLPVQIVEQKQKFHSNQMAPDLFIVENAIKNINQKDFSKKKNLTIISFLP
jgi:hypothetical protein